MMRAMLGLLALCGAVTIYVLWRRSLAASAALEDAQPATYSAVREAAAA